LLHHGNGLRGEFTVAAPNTRRVVFPRSVWVITSHGAAQGGALAPTPATAVLIVVYRQKNGGLKKIEDWCDLGAILQRIA
jgi:hypothetical protein